MKDPYEILQVSKNAEIEVIEVAYRRLARKYHPDTNPSPDSTKLMQEINWAYELLRDPLERQRYDHAHSHQTASQSYTPPRSYSQEASKSTSSSTREASPRPTPRRPTPSATARKQPPEKTFWQKYWLLIILAAAAYIYVTNFSESTVDQSSTPPDRSSSAAINHDPYADCIPWTMTGLYDGQRKCVLGMIIFVSHEYDPTSGADIWTGYFSMNSETGFRVISVDRDISKWEGQCVVVYGTLFDRDQIREYADNPAPSMVDSDPYDDRGFSISSAPTEKCQ